MKVRYLLFITTLLQLSSCRQQHTPADASGAFEAEEVIVSAEAAGRILTFELREGDLLSRNDTVGSIDAELLQLQQAQLRAADAALDERRLDSRPQIEVLAQQLQVQRRLIAAQQAQLKWLSGEKERFEKLVAAEAAPAKQLDDISGQYNSQQEQLAAAIAQLDVIGSQIVAQREQERQQNRAILSERGPNAQRIRQVEEQIARSRIINPIEGTVLTTYAHAGEMTAPGKALYKIADLRSLNLRAYVSGSQLASIKLGQRVQVAVDDGRGEFRSYTGEIYWISATAEFTPRTILTKDERANQVYALKVRVPNKDGYLKIGMYGELRL